jgi:hypothetical protein
METSSGKTSDLSTPCLLQNLFDFFSLLTPNNQGHMDSFYTRLLKLSFPDSISAIEYCRELSSQYGFTVKQEASSNRVRNCLYF